MQLPKLRSPFPSSSCSHTGFLHLLEQKSLNSQPQLLLLHVQTAIIKSDLPPSNFTHLCMILLLSNSCASHDTMSSKQTSFVSSSSIARESKRQGRQPQPMCLRCLLFSLRLSLLDSRASLPSCALRSSLLSPAHCSPRLPSMLFEEFFDVA